MSENQKSLLPPPCWVFGLPVDCLSLEEAQQLIVNAVHTRTRVIFSTPNTDFLAESHSDSAFRDALLACDFSVADGLPVVWLGRAVGAPIPMRVAGSSLLDSLISAPTSQGLRIFFFGGEEDMARLASEALERTPGGAVAAGWLNPGFVSMEEMSRPELLARINAAKPDFLVVALGAKKGHEWISRNAAALNATVISHLGAAIGFVAGTRTRSPRVMQAIGFEWFWRMLMEPRLMRRYAWDFVFLLRTVVVGLVPTLINRMSSDRTAATLTLKVAEPAPEASIHLFGQLLGSTLPVLEDGLNRGNLHNIVLDVSGVTEVDSQAIGYLYHLKYRCSNRVSRVVCQPGTRVNRLFYRHGATVLLS